MVGVSAFVQLRGASGRSGLQSPFSQINLLVLHVSASFCEQTQHKEPNLKHICTL